MISVFLDSVGLLAIWDEDDRWHGAASRAYASIARRRARLVTTTVVLAECGNAAARYAHRLEQDLLRTRLMRGGMLVFPTDEDWDTAWSSYRHGEAGNAGIVDQTSFAVMRRLGVTRAFTNDRHFRAAGMEPLF